MTPACLIPVRCPHCGAVYAIDPGLETASIVDGSDAPPTGATPVTFRPTCPRCGRRVTVRVSSSSVKLPQPVLPSRPCGA